MMMTVYSCPVYTFSLPHRTSDNWLLGRTGYLANANLITRF